MARVLIVGDAADVRTPARALLEAAGHEVATAAAGRAGVEAARREHPDLILLDLSPPLLSGWEATRELKSDPKTAATPVVAVSADAEEQDRERASAAGCDGFISSPIDEKTFAPLVASFLTGRGESTFRLAAPDPAAPVLPPGRNHTVDGQEEIARLKTDFLAMVSHEVRAPLNTIILLTHLLEREVRTPADAERRLHEVHVIRESSGTLLWMINNLLDLARLEAGQRDLHPQLLDVESFLRETADSFEMRSRAKGVPLLVERAPNLPVSAVLDGEKLSRVLVNLLANAVDNTRQGRVALRCRRREDAWEFEVDDTGPGVPQNVIAEAFEPLRRIRSGSRETGRGIGLGLFLSSKLVELMGGALVIAVREGQGTRVSFAIPELEEPEITKSRDGFPKRQG
ncbi:MAG TPA: hybrid sensor histidine kinase/response regulator [Thermoanaerobaculia bacterium]|nr:hybrid sensor histidine kinase/response regulator [Thermoanaerobaculia bacterium]